MPTPPPATDADFIIHEGRWPQWPLLPLKRYPAPKSPPQVATLIARLAPEDDTAGPFNVYLCNMYSPLETILVSEKLIYSTAAALVADGWVVD